MKSMLVAGGLFHLAFALFHLAFWRLFRWREELGRLGFINRNVMQILNICLTFVFLAVAWISFMHAEALLNTALGKTLLAAVALFWLLRAALQVIYFGLRDIVSLAFFAAFVLGTALYAVPVLAS